MTPEQKSPKPQPIVGEGAPKAKATVVEEAPKVEPIVVEASGSECQTLEVVAPQQQNGTSLQQTNSTTPKSEDSYDPKRTITLTEGGKTNTIIFGIKLTSHKSGLILFRLPF